MDSWCATDSVPSPSTNVLMANRPSAPTSPRADTVLPGTVDSTVYPTRSPAGVPSSHITCPRTETVRDWPQPAVPNAMAKPVTANVILMAFQPTAVKPVNLLDAHLSLVRTFFKHAAIREPRYRAAPHGSCRVVIPRH